MQLVACANSGEKIVAADRSATQLGDTLEGHVRLGEHPRLCGVAGVDKLVHNASPATDPAAPTPAPATDPAALVSTAAPTPALAPTLSLVAVLLALLRCLVAV